MMRMPRCHGWGGLCALFSHITRSNYAVVIGMAAGGDGFVTLFAWLCQHIGHRHKCCVGQCLRRIFATVAIVFGNFICSACLPAIIAMMMQSAKPSAKPSGSAFVITICFIISALTQGGESILRWFFRPVSLATTAGFNFLLADNLRCRFYGSCAGFHWRQSAGGIKINRAILVGREVARPASGYPSSVSVTYAGRAAIG